MTTISVIMGVYNIANYDILSASIYSILNQSYTDFEFIICDDGSTNETFQWLSKFVELDNRIILLKNKKNMGLAYSLNKCIKRSIGKFIARQDADDISHIDRLKEEFYFLKQNPHIDFVGTNLRYFSNKHFWGKYSLPLYPQKKDFLFTVPFIHATLMFRKNILMSSNGYLVSKLTLRCEDYELLMRLYSMNYHGANIQKYLYYVREDDAAKKRRKYKFRIAESIIRFYGYYKLHLFPIGILYSIKPLIVGVIPTLFLDILKDIYYRRKGY